MTVASLVSDIGRSQRHRALLIAGIAFCLLFVRRSAQLLDPQVWDEDGRIVSDIIASGPLALFHPLNGYFVMLSKAVSFIALLAPFPAYALVSTAIVWGLIVAVACAIFFAPTTLRGRFLLVVATFLIPSDPEVFGVPLYEFWWSALLLFLVVLWQPNGGKLGWRAAFTIVGGLSSPVIVLIFPVAVLRALRHRNRSEIAIGALATMCALAQGTAVALAGEVSTPPGMALLGTVAKALPKFAGTYELGNLRVFGDAVTQAVLIAVTALLFILVAASASRDPAQREGFLILAYLWLGSVALSCSRVNPDMLVPSWAGPRYFFYPYILEGWMLVQVVCGSAGALVRRTALVALILAVINSVPVLRRTHDDLHFGMEARKCAKAPRGTRYILPIQYDGIAAHAWQLPVNSDDCRRLNRYGLIGLMLPPH